MPLHAAGRNNATPTPLTTNFGCVCGVCGCVGLLRCEAGPYNALAEERASGTAATVLLAVQASPAGRSYEASAFIYPDFIDMFPRGKPLEEWALPLAFHEIWPSAALEIERLGAGTTRHQL